ncbi:caspase family protein [Streptomyces sp. NPDC057199]|uniref:caspase, EACC1-associated type n=1 Tax=Streptomyces sp. NPDC057199 TaxID=3346047 RepID=UPI00362E055D
MLIGTASYENMPDLPNVANNLDALRSIFTAPVLLGLAPEHCTVILDPAEPHQVLRAVRAAAREAEDTLIVYYAGHGHQTDDDFDLYLGLVGSDEVSPERSLRYELLRKAVRSTRATRRVVILDSCYSGLAMNAMGGSATADPALDLARQAGIEGAFLMCSASRNRPSLAPPGERYTAFTGELIEVLTSGVTDEEELLSLEAIFRQVHARLTAKSRPRPRLQVLDNIGHLALVRNLTRLAWGAPREQDDRRGRSPGGVSATQGRSDDAFMISTATLPSGSPAAIAFVCGGIQRADRAREASLTASRTANASIRRSLNRGVHPQQALHEAIADASQSVRELAHASESPMQQLQHSHPPSCTLVGAVVMSEILCIGWVGDSRAYWVPVDRTTLSARLTEDDTWGAEMVANGRMSDAEAYADERSGTLTQWLGADAHEVEPHTATFKPDRPGVIILCTSGLWRHADEAEDIAAALPLDSTDRPLHGAQTLLNHALVRGGRDNITAVVVPFPAPPARGT